MSDTKKILEQYKNDTISLEEALLELKKAPFADIGYAKVDLHRKVRQGAAEVIYGEGKTPEQIIGICDAMLKNGQKTILITRLSEAAAGIISNVFQMTYHAQARIGIIGSLPAPDGIGKIVVATVFTSSLESSCN